MHRGGQSRCFACKYRISVDLVFVSRCILSGENLDLFYLSLLFFSLNLALRASTLASWSHTCSVLQSLANEVRPSNPDATPCVTRTNEISRFMSRRWSISAGED